MAKCEVCGNDYDKSFEVHRYDDAGHGFFSVDRPGYRVAAANDGWERIATFFAANSMVEDVFMLTVSFNLYFTRPVAEGDVVARGRVVSRSKRLYLADGTLEDARGREIARGSGAFMPSTQALSTDIGYR